MKFIRSNPFSSVLLQLHFTDCHQFVHLSPKFLTMLLLILEKDLLSACLVPSKCQPTVSSSFPFFLSQLNVCRKVFQAILQQFQILSKCTHYLKSTSHALVLNFPFLNLDKFVIQISFIKFVPNYTHAGCIILHLLFWHR